MAAQFGRALGEEMSGMIEGRLLELGIRWIKSPSCLWGSQHVWLQIDMPPSCVNDHSKV